MSYELFSSFFRAPGDEPSRRHMCAPRVLFAFRHLSALGGQWGLLQPFLECWGPWLVASDEFALWFGAHYNPCGYQSGSDAKGRQHIDQCQKLMSYLFLRAKLAPFSLLKWRKPSLPSMVKLFGLLGKFFNPPLTWKYHSQQISIFF